MYVDRQAGNQASRQADKTSGRQIFIQSGIQVCRQAFRKTSIKADRQAFRQAGRPAGIQIFRHTLILIKLRPHSRATTPARRVLPVPGAPYSSRPDLSLRGMLENRAGYLWGRDRGSG